MPRDKVTFDANVPVRVALEFASGKLAEGGQYGDQYYFSLSGNRCMYVPPIVERQIRELGIRPGEEFEICKTVKKVGRSSETRWIVGYDAAPVNESAPVTRPEPTPTTDPIPLAGKASGANQSTRRERMASLLSDCLSAASDAMQRANVRLDGKEFQDVVVTLYINEQRREELEVRRSELDVKRFESKMRYGGHAAPPANGNRANGGASWPTSH